MNDATLRDRFVAGLWHENPGLVQLLGLCPLLAVSNTAASDPGTWGPTGRLPGFPGSDAYPPQPMMDQIRKMLDDYRAAGGMYEEVSIADSGHVPFITHPEEFNRAFHALLEQNNPQET